MSKFVLDPDQVKSFIFFQENISTVCLLCSKHSIAVIVSWDWRNILSTGAGDRSPGRQEREPYWTTNFFKPSQAEPSQHTTTTWAIVVYKYSPSSSHLSTRIFPIQFNPIQSNNASCLHRRHRSCSRRFGPGKFTSISNHQPSFLFDFYLIN